ncbi:hypothetical protein PTE30175_01095 [Pandoraea terrae]|uniref:DUF1116 domain-containing protein n=1 Tax=Pandoraea terrae TaxID=1537710 RepID=A0A5E4T3U5_9BURK|nr:DUF1116 domain-containing protein [Pandoraea terrae]VVD81643.1 hypothetical protein PTE30175_01095 [Pandoraea terrae]
MSKHLLDKPLSVLSLGVATLDAGASAGGATLAHLDWQPAGDGDPELSWQLASLIGDPDDPDCAGSRVDRANAEAVSRVIAAEPVWVDVALHASEVWPDMGRTLLHAGPPIAWRDMCGPMRGAVVGAALYEGWADTPDEAERLADSGAIRFAPCHEWGAVGPMAGIISPSMPLFVVENRAAGNRAYAPMMESGGAKTLRFGAYAPEVLAGLRWLETVMAPTLKAVVTASPDGWPLKPVMAQALHMGDDVHNRNTAASLALLRWVAQGLVNTDIARSEAVAALRVMRADDMFFLSLSMAACKATMDAAHGVPHSSLVTAMARNGVNVGVRVSGLGEQWFTGPADIPVGLYLPGFSEADANPDIGDSAITETAGLGAFAMAAAPAMVQFVGGTPQDALRYSRDMATISVARNPGFTLPALDFIGAPVGIDVRRVLDDGMRPVINTATAHKQPGMGIIGAGIVQAPLRCFTTAVAALAEQCAQNDRNESAGSAGRR